MMKSHRNRILKGVILLLLFPAFHMAVINYDICNNTLEFVHVELWDTGTLSSGGSCSNKSRVNCHFRMIACDACSFKLQIRDKIDLLPVCHSNRSDLPKLPTCLQGCSHLVIYEPAYTDVTTRFYFPQDPLSSMSSFISLSSSVSVMLCQPEIENSTSQTGVIFHYEVTEKISYVTGNTSKPSTMTGLLSSPNFPRGYALRGELYTYVLYNTDPGGGIQLVFDDWDLAPHSRVSVFTNISTHSTLGTHFGSGPRPVIFVPGQYLYITFEPDIGITSRANNMGFQASYTFLSGSNRDSLPPFSTDCGVYYKYLTGGNITFQGGHHTSTPSSSSVVWWDCVWVILPHSAFDWIILRLINQSFTGNQTLIIRSCVVSDCPLVTNITSTGNTSFPMTTQLEGRNGFYIRVRGPFTSTDMVSLIFAAFNRAEPDGCRHAGEFECMSGHCIDRHLVCDGHIHCEDRRDESITCKQSPSVLSNVPVACKDEEFACANGRRCVPKTAVCDTWLDCQDGSDEYQCLSHTSESPDGLVDGLYEGVECEIGSEPCHHGRQCISPQLLCDGKYDCWDRSDEMHCALGFETSLRNPAPWRVVMPLGIALCVLLSLCVLALCLRTFVKQERSDCESRTSSRSSSRPRCSHRAGRSPRSVTSETPLTLDLSRSTSGVTAESPMPDSPPSYEEAMRRSPEGATAPNSADSCNNQLSPSVLSPPAYHIPITGKQHFTFSTLWPLTSASPSTRNQKRNIEEANLQLLASDFNSSSGNSEPGSTVGLNVMADDTTYLNGSIPQSQIICQIEVDHSENVSNAETSSAETATTWSSVRECEVTPNGRGSVHEYSPNGSLHLKLQSAAQNNSRASSLERTPERKGYHKQCHCHCKGHENRRLVNKRTRCRSTGSESVSSSCSHLHSHHRHSCSCSPTEVQLKEICVKNRNAKDSSNCDSHEEECLLPSEPDSPLLLDDEEEEDIISCNSKTYGSHIESQLSKNVQCLVHENRFCDTVC